MSQAMNAIERARAAYEEMMQRQRDVAMVRQARDHKRKVRVMVALGTVAGLLFGVALYNGWLTQGLRSTLLAGDGSTKRFGETRTGQVRTMMQGNTCKELNFSNDSGSYVSGNLVACEQVVTRDPKPAASSGARVNSIRDAFTR
jgi:hypothetical protein